MYMGLPNTYDNGPYPQTHGYIIYSVGVFGKSWWPFFLTPTLLLRCGHSTSQALRLVSRRLPNKRFGTGGGVEG